MSKNATVTEAETTVDTVEIDRIEVIHKGQCPSLSGRSTLEFCIGRHRDNDTVHLAITANRGGGGMWSRAWASGSDIQDVVLSEEALTAKSFQVLHLGRSINTGGFVLAALKELGLMSCINEESSRVHKYVPGATFEKAVANYFAAHEAAPTKKSKKLKES